MRAAPPSQDHVSCEGLLRASRIVAEAHREVHELFLLLLTETSTAEQHAKGRAAIARGRAAAKAYENHLSIHRDIYNSARAEGDPRFAESVTEAFGDLLHPFGNSEYAFDLVERLIDSREELAALGSRSQ